jgi:magnesium-protoporphyrin O-methyltransferase
MTNCQCQGLNNVFNDREAQRELRAYRRNGADGTTRTLIDAIKTQRIDGWSLLDIGGGVGAIQHELLKAGAGQATDVDASAAFVRAAQQEAQRQGHAERVTHHVGDFVTLAERIDPADIVTLDRVLCCYDNAEALVKLSAAHARRLYGLVYPRDHWWMKIGQHVFNFFLWLFRSQFRFFVHRTEQIEGWLREAGWRQQFYRATRIWQVILYARP